MITEVSADLPRKGSWPSTNCPKFCCEVFERMLSSLRKFGLGFCDLPTMLWNVSYFLRVSTLNIDDRWENGIPIYFYIISAVICSAYFYVYLVSMVWFIVWRCAETGDLLAAIIVFSLGIASEISTVKFICMYIYITKVRQIVSESLACDALVEPNSRFANNLAQTLRLVKKRAIMFWMVVIGNGVIYIGKPLLMPGRHFMEDLYILYGLEPMYESPNFEIAFCLFAMGVTFSCYLPANITAFFIVVSGYTEAQMIAWSEELRHLWQDANNNYDSYFQKSLEDNLLNCEDKNIWVNSFIRKRLIQIIKGHSTNINRLQDIETVFRVAIAGEFSLLVIGMIAELLGGLENTYLEMPFALIQVGMDCLVGQRLIDASTGFERAVYQSKWENFDTSNMRIVLLILQNSQKKMTLSAGGITTLSFMSLMTVIKSIYSAYTTLRTTMK